MWFCVYILKLDVLNCIYMEMSVIWMLMLYIKFFFFIRIIKCFCKLYYIIWNIYLIKKEMFLLYIRKLIIIVFINNFNFLFDIGELV